MSTAEPTSEPAVGAPGLRRGCLGFLETIGQSVAGIAPTGTPAVAIAAIAAVAGAGTWLSFLIATVGMLFVAGNIATLAGRYRWPALISSISAALWGRWPA
jgi:amino acid transporter